MTSHHDRMAQIGFWTLPREGTSRRKHIDEDLARHQDNPAWQALVRETFQNAVALVNIQEKNGAGFSADKQLREYNLEYNGRVFNGSLRDMPSSFNVVEAFNKFIPRSATFELRTENDHIFSFQHFLDWATTDAADGAADIAPSFLHEGLVYSYNSYDKPSSLLFGSNDGDEFGFASISLIRFGSEISVVLTGGLKCDLAAETKVLNEAWETMQANPNRSHIKPDENLQHRAEPLPEDQALWKIVTLLRLDVETKTVDARYVFKDCGNTYSGHTDDVSAYLDEDGKIADEFKTQIGEANESLKRYGALFELAKTCLLLPVYFDNNDDDIEIQRHPTEFKEFRKQLKNKKTIERVDSRHWITHREVKKISSAAKRTPDFAAFDAPDFKIERSGHWRKLSVDVEGQDKQGRPIQGRTWVNQVQSWVEVPSDARTIYASRENAPRSGANPGYIYVVRSAAHAKDIFKVGLTRRTTEERSKELSRTTGSPDHFLVVQEWATGDCVLAEQQIHAELDQYRINPNREFFQAPYKVIVAAIDKVLSTLEAR